MMRWILAYGAAGAVFLAGDAVWLTLAVPRLYRPAIGEMLAGGVRLGPAAAFYLIYLVGVVVLAAEPAARAGGWPRALVLGAVLGVVAYSAYDLTNMATLKLWSMKVTVADIVWGGFITAAASCAACLAAAGLSRH